MDKQKSLKILTELTKHMTELRKYYPGTVYAKGAESMYLRAKDLLLSAEPTKFISDLVNDEIDELPTVDSAIAQYKSDTVPRILTKFKIQ